MRFNWIKLLILTCTILQASGAFAEVYKRTVSFEWEPIENAKTYEIELAKKSAAVDEAPLIFNTETAEWSGPLSPGIYTMRIRSKDRRGVPGIWSNAEEFKVNLDPVHPVQPKTGETIQAQEETEHKTTFHWLAVGGAEGYLFELRSDDGSTQIKQTITATQHTMMVPVAKNYTWNVKAVGVNSESETVQPMTFVLIGKQLSAPKIEKPENAFVRNLKWSPSNKASHYAFSIKRQDPKTKKWEPIALDQDYKNNQIRFEPKWRGGRYRLSLKAKGELRPSSPTVEIEFPVFDGNRSPASEEIATTRESIDRISGWYSIASYLITMVDYKGQNRDKNSGLNYQAIGGTGRLGAGYLSKGSPWGFVGIADLGGLTLEGAKTIVFASVETNGIYRTTMGSRGELRQQFGLFYKELPETIGSTGDNITESNTITTAGPHYGVEYWYALTPKLGFQTNAHFYPSLFKIKTPTNQAIQPTISTQFGILGSYRLRKNVTGLAGYAYRHDEVSYKANPGSTSEASDGDINNIQLEGHYLNLFLEWAL